MTGRVSHAVVVNGLHLLVLKNIHDLHSLTNSFINRDSAYTDPKWTR